MDWGALAGAIVDTQNGWLNFISQGMANRTNRQNVIDANNQNAALAEQANQWNIDQWNRVNAYNSPSAQRARLEAAGLNPALVYGQGGLTNEASPMPGANVANMQAASAMAPQLPLIGSQVALNMAQARKLDAETEYQGYVNAVEKALSDAPLRTSIVTGENGESSVVVHRGNARAEFALTELRMLGLSEQGLQTQLADLIFDLAVRVGDNSFTDLSNFDPLQTPGGIAESAALRGDRQVRDLSGQLAQIGYDAAKAEKAGREAYSKWLDDHKDDPVVKFALTLQGFLQTMGISLPSFGGKTQGYTSGGVYHATSKSWYFGK